MRIPSLFLLLTAASVSGAYAEEVPVVKVSPAMFTVIDRNGDQRISKTEAGPYKYIIDRFAYIDTNGDGFITQDELTANITASAVD